MTEEKRKINFEVIFAKIKIFFHDTFKFPFYILTHPIKGWEMFKEEKKGKLYVTIIYALLMILSSVLLQTSAGFLITPPRDDTFSLLRTSLLIIVPIILVSVGNWSITTLFDGKGKLHEIFMVVIYGLIPYIWLSIPAILVSNFLIVEETQFYFAVIGIGSVLAGYKIFTGLLVIHEYTVLRAILTILVTAIAAAVMIFIGLLILTLFQQLYSFFKSIYDELMLRIRSVIL